MGNGGVGPRRFHCFVTQGMDHVARTLFWRPVRLSSALTAITPRLFATLAFPPSRDTNIGISSRLGLYPSLRSRLTAHDGSDAYCYHAADWAHSRVAFTPSPDANGRISSGLVCTRRCAPSSPVRLSSALTSYRRPQLHSQRPPHQDRHFRRPAAGRRSWRRPCRGPRRRQPDRPDRRASR